MNLEDLKVIESLTDDERKAVEAIVKEISSNGKSDDLTSLYYEDYEEIPVDLTTFLCSDTYLGNYTNHGKDIYQTWKDELAYVHNPATFCDQWAITGSTGTGKSTVATYSLAYELYKLMCLKNPNRFYLNANETIWILFFNLNLKLAEKTMWGKFQKALQMSPWFMERGTVTGRTNLVYQPNKDLRLDIGSTEEHALSVAVMFCLEGNTEVLTDEGYKKIQDLAGTKTNIYTYDKEKGITYKENNIEVIQNCLVNELIEIELEDDYIIKCTPEHKFMLKNGEYKQAKDLTEQDELMDIDSNCGIYFIENKLNNKIYVGQSKNLKSRIESHKSNPVKLLKEDIENENQSYLDNINIYIAEYCSEENLDERERYYIQLLNSEYPNGYNQQLGGKNHWEACTELKQKLQDNAKENLIGRVWMTNQKENIYVFENEVDYYLDSGYGYGKTNLGGNIK